MVELAFSGFFDSPSFSAAADHSDLLRMTGGEISVRYINVKNGLAKAETEKRSRVSSSSKSCT